MKKKLGTKENLWITTFLETQWSTSLKKPLVEAETAKAAKKNFLKLLKERPDFETFQRKVQFLLDKQSVMK